MNISRLRLHIAAVSAATAFALVLPIAAFGAVENSTEKAGNASQIAFVRQWAQSAFSDQTASPPIVPGIFARQDYGELQVDHSVMGTPLNIGSVSFDHGLGTHAFSDILVNLPAKATHFTADVGIDENGDSKGHGSCVIFAVTVGAREVYRSAICREGDAPVKVDIDLPDVSSFILQVFAGADTLAYNQADWADASATLANGQQQMLDALPLNPGPSGLSKGYPFAFTYGGSPADLSTWKRSFATAPASSGRAVSTLTLTDPATGLQLRCVSTRFTGYPAVDWVLYLKNTSMQDTPIIEHLLPLDLGMGAPAGNVVLHRLNGCNGSLDDFMPKDDPIGDNSGETFSPYNGKSSDGQFPYFNVGWTGGGLAGAIGWSGEWQYHIGLSGRQLLLAAGQQWTHFVLHPGEEVRTPRILLVFWKGEDQYVGSNLMRQVLLNQYIPQEDGHAAYAPVTYNSWCAFNSGNGVTEANQIADIPGTVESGCEGCWLDAGWFTGGWPGGVGNWTPNPTAFPNGLRPLSDAAHRSGLKFVLWFEPERVCPNTMIATQHPGWLLHCSQENSWGTVFNLGNPEARAWLTNLIAGDLNTWGVDIYRNDFNISPLPFWQASDAPDRQGITEMKYVAGLYAMWDDLRRRKPGLLIDNCASGGRRLDLEMMSRSIPLWRNDTQVDADHPTSNQAQTAGLSEFIPIDSVGDRGVDAYDFRSIATTGIDFLTEPTNAAYVSQASKMVTELKRLRPYYLGDYYPLTPVDLDETHWCAWQFNRTSLAGGFVTCFRRSACTAPSMVIALHGLDASAVYTVVDADTGATQTLTGAQLTAGLTVQIPDQPGSAVVTYTKIR